MASEAVEREGKSYWGMGARHCDSCKSSPALLFCRADSAFLCGPCDSKVHGANKLASRHERVWMCEVCEQAPASVTCKADAAALCSSCDHDIHSANPLARRHERVPVLPFFHSPDQNKPAARKTNLQRNSDEEEEEDDEAEAESWFLPGSNNNKAVDAPEVKGVPVCDQYFFSDVDPYLDLDYAASMDPRFHQMDSVVPVKNRSSAVGVPFHHHHHPPPFFAAAAAPCPDGSYDFDFSGSKLPYSNVSSLSHSVSSSEVGVVPDGSAITDISNPFGMAGGGPATVVGSPATVPAATAVGMDREARVMRYREKRKNRKFEKTIRYASRKAYAETRPRVKGRFAKRTELDGNEEGDLTIDDIYSASAAAVASLMAERAYGVVPSF